MQADQPVVSVLMPVYNTAPTLEEALASLSSQTLENFEVIVVDDGSTDSTWSILENWSKKDRRFHIIHRDHSGIVAALNLGFKVCRAGLIARMDADDRSSPERLGRQAEMLQQNDEIALVSCQVKAFSDGELREGFNLYVQWQNSLLDNDHIKREVFIESPFSHPSIMIRRAWLERMGGYMDYGWPEDYDLWLRMHLAGARFVKLPMVLLEWRDHSHSLTRTDSRYSLENFLRLKAHYLKAGPLSGRESIFIWGAGMTGRRLSKHLIREGVPVKAFFDIDPRKIGKTRRGLPIFSFEALPETWKRADRPVLVAAVGARGARPLIRRHLLDFQLTEGVDWWFVA
jgi:glycosyltransferase involved in cell wall biosynthesis